MGCWCSRRLVVVNELQLDVRDHLADGGFGSIDLVEDGRNHRLYALKRILCFSEADEKRARHEVDVTRRLSAAAEQSGGGVSVIRFIDSSFLELDAVRFSSSTNLQMGAVSELLMLLEFCPGGSLQEEIETKQRGGKHFSQKAVLDVAIPMSRALKFMHCLRPTPFAHRDFKPANVLFRKFPSTHPVLTDFGSATELTIEITKNNLQHWRDWSEENCFMLCRAPEWFHLAEEMSIDQSADTWSFGCVLYWMLFLMSPFSRVYDSGGSIALACMNVEQNIEFPSIADEEQDGFASFTNESNDHDEATKQWQQLTTAEVVAVEPSQPQVRCDYSDALVRLAKRCLSEKPADRPSFDRIVESLLALVE